MQRHIAERQTRDGLQAQWRDRDGALPDRVAAGVFHIVQEALNNVVKHAGVGTATITLNLAGTPVCVEVADEGAGFEVSEGALRRGHFGLSTMTERAKEIGWNLTIDSQPGRGTRLRIAAPPTN